MQVYLLESQIATRCGNCGRFRYIRKKTDERLICDDCYLTFVNQKLITAIQTPPKPKPQKDKPNPKKERTPKPRVPKVKKIDNFLSYINNLESYIRVVDLAEFGTKPTLYDYCKKLSEQDKVRTLSVKGTMYVSSIQNYHLLEAFHQESLVAKKRREGKNHKISLVKDRVIGCLLSTEIPLDSRAIEESINAGHSQVYQALVDLFKEGKIKRKASWQNKYFYIESDREYLLSSVAKANQPSNNNKIEKKDIAGKLLSIINSEDKIFDSTLFDNAKEKYGVCDRTLFRALRVLQEKGLIVVSEYIRGQKTYFASNKPHLIEKMESIDSSGTRRQVIEFLQSNERFVTINQIIKAIGKKWRSGGTYRYVKKIVDSLDCEIAGNENVTYYRLRKDLVS